MKEMIASTPHFATSAAISSGLEELLAQLSSLCGGAFTLTFARSAEVKTREALALIEKKAKKAGEALTGLIVHTTNAATGASETAPVTVAMVDGWMKRFPPLAREFRDPAVLLHTLAKAGAKNTEILNARATVRADVLTSATMALHAPSTSYKFAVFPLITRHRCKMVTAADRAFIYQHLRRNGAPGREIVYFMDGERAIPIPREERSGCIPPGDDDFWGAFYRANDALIHSTLADIEAAAYAFEQERATAASGMPERSFDDVLLDLAPQALLRYAVLTRRSRVEESEDGKKREFFDSFLVECQLGSTDRSGKREKWHEALSRSLLYELDLSEIAPAPQFSNTPGAGLVCIPLTGEYADGTPWAIDVSGQAGVHAAENGENPPLLPTEFRRFFYGADGASNFFASDERMCLLRLADFVFRVLVDGTYCRQCLTLAGAGKDGKSILIKVLAAVLGIPETTLDAEKLDDPANTYTALNSPLIIMPEVRKPGAVFSSSFFKRLTGGDTMQLRKLFCMAVDWRPEHSRLMMTTNERVFLFGDAQVSRCLPIACQKAYTPRTARPEAEIVAACLSQRVEFLQWVCDTRAYYKALKTPSGEPLGLFMPDRLMIVTDADFADILAGTRSLLDMSERERRQVERQAIESTGSGRFIVTFGDEASEDEVEWMASLFDAVFEVAEGERVLRPQLAKAIIEGCEKGASRTPKNSAIYTATTALGINTASILHDKRFVAFKAWMEAEGRVSVKKIGGLFYYVGVRLKASKVTPAAEDLASLV